MKRYKTVDEIIASISETTEFCRMWFLHTIQTRKHPDEFPINCYQRCARIYLDEYEGQEELRKHWFGKNHDMFNHLYTRFLRRN